MPSVPNVLFILSDNVGFGDPGCYGGGELRMAPTPRIDALAAEGLRLTNFSVEAECTPTRAAVLTGRMSIRTGCHLAARWPLRPRAVGVHDAADVQGRRVRHRVLRQVAPRTG